MSLSNLVSIIFALIFYCNNASAEPFTTLKWTNPCFNSAVDDSGYSYCGDSPDSLHDLGWIEVWGQPSWGGGWRKLTEVSGLAKECVEDSVSVDRVYNWASWHYYLIPRDLVGNRNTCSPTIIFVQGSQVTGVDDESSADVSRIVFFDVQGRRTNAYASGIYWKRIWYRDGRVVTKKVLVLK